MKVILGIGIFALAIWLAVCLLACQVQAQYPWGNQDYWGSPYGGYTSYLDTGFHGGYWNGASFYGFDDSYGYPSSYQGMYYPARNKWAYTDGYGSYWSGYGRNPYW